MVLLQAVTYLCGAWCPGVHLRPVLRPSGSHLEAGAQAKAKEEARMDRPEPRRRSAGQQIPHKRIAYRRTERPLLEDQAKRLLGGAEVGGCGAP